MGDHAAVSRTLVRRPRKRGGRASEPLVSLSIRRERRRDGWIEGKKKGGREGERVKKG